MPRKYVLALFLTALTPAIAAAQKDVASCKPVLDASAKQATTPYHSYASMTEVPTDSKPRLSETINIGGVSYVQVQGRWQKFPITPAEIVQQSEDNIRSATAYSCKHLNDESVGGVAAAVYSSHIENLDVKADSRIWVAKSTGLVLRIDSDVGSSHIAQRFEYTNVQAPAGVQ